ncbi:SGNH/GDSL hydrolase family protein [Candidatus Curtissbacteria bacterium]|nr:SGNH/GDSL hydrolase family protein [Candidatus Curtissbacteria bacterium]
MFFNLAARITYFLKDFSLYLLLDFIAIVTFIFMSYKLYKAKIDKKSQTIYLSLSFTIVIIILVFSLSEAYFRYVYDEPDGLGFLKVDKRWHQRHDVFNNYFFRDRNFEVEKPAGVTRIAVMGDSITQGGGIENVEDRFSNILEEKLKSAEKKVEVYNLGKSGYDTTEEIKQYENVRHLKFDILIWEYFINDIQPQTSTGTPILVKHSKKAKIVQFLSDRSFLFDYVYWRFSQRYQNTFKELATADIDQYSNQSVLENHKKEITEFIDSLNKDKIKVVVIMFPSNFLIGPSYPSHIHQIMGDYFRKQGVIFIDLLPDLKDKNKKTLMASKFDPHPNEFVHKIAAERLFERIIFFIK